MCRVNSFLGCVSLETFGLFIGWFEMLFNIILAIVSIFGIVLFITEKNTNGVFACIVVLIVCFFLAYICKELIRGIETRDHRKMYGFRVLCIAIIFAGVVNLLLLMTRLGLSSETVEHPHHRMNPASAMVSLVVAIYVFVCIDSLYRKIEEEWFPSTNPVVLTQPSPYVVHYSQSPYNPNLVQPFNKHFYLDQPFLPSAPKY